MPLPEAWLDHIANSEAAMPGGVPVKRGENIFEGTDYPRDWSGFIGQEVAKRQLQVALASARARGARMEHTLIASGIAGVGKTTLATMTAYLAGVGIVQSTGPVTFEDARRVLMSMEDRDIWFIDEAHLLVQGNRNRADWLLPWMLEGKLYGPRGAETTPDVTLVAATTDAGKLPQTLLTRFMMQPKIVAYTEVEATKIAMNLAQRMKVAEIVPSMAYPRIAKASSHNPRTMRRVLTTLRDLAHATPGTAPDLALALEWCGLSEDGLDTMAQDMLLVLLGSPNNTASIESIQAQLNEPGPLRHAEQALLQRGFLAVSGRGRQLTDTGLARAVQLVRERR